MKTIALVLTLVALIGCSTTYQQPPSNAVYMRRTTPPYDTVVIY